jgi:plastocyanin
MQAALASRPVSLPGPASFRWHSLRWWCGALAAAALAGTGVLLGEREAAGLAALAGVGMLFARFRVAVIALAGIFVATLVFMLPGAAVNLVHGQGLMAYFVPLTLSAVSIAGLIGAVGSLVKPTGRSRAAFWVVVAVTSVYSVALFGGAVVSQARTVARLPNELTVSVRTNAFSTTTLTAERGRVTIRFANNDLFWHTFTSDALGVNLRVPVNAAEEISFDAAPGTYDFYCAIPGHALIGMRGTLVIR